jgi:hypothetical protein
MLRSGIAVGEALPVDGLGERTANVVLYVGLSIAGRRWSLQAILGARKARGSSAGSRTKSAKSR